MTRAQRRTCRMEVGIMELLARRDRVEEPRRDRLGEARFYPICGRDETRPGSSREIPLSGVNSRPDERERLAVRWKRGLAPNREAKEPAKTTVVRCLSPFSNRLLASLASRGDWPATDRPAHAFKERSNGYWPSPPPIGRAIGPPRQPVGAPLAEPDHHLLPGPLHPM